LRWLRPGCLLRGCWSGVGYWLRHHGAGPAAAPGPSPSATATPSGSPTATPTVGTLAGVWRRLPALPLSGWDSGAVGVWTGTELIVYEQTPTADLPATTVGAALNPATRRWRTLPAIPAPPGRYEGHDSAVWTGRQLLVWGGQTERGGQRTTPPRGYAYDPDTDRWRPLPVSPLRGRVGHTAVWTGGQMLIFGGLPVNAGDGARPLLDGARPLLDGAGYAPARTP
jgi:hypothetical protein